MPAPLNKKPDAWVPAYIIKKVSAETGKSGYPLGMRRLYGAMNMTRPSQNASFIHSVTQAHHKARLDSRVSHAIDAVVKAIFFNYDYVTGIVNIRTERQLAILAGLATYQGKIIVMKEQYEVIQREQPDALPCYIAYNAIPVSGYNNIGHGRVSKALAILREMKLVEYLDKELRCDDGRYIGRALWVTDEFYAAFGRPVDARIRAEREYLMRQTRFLQHFGITEKPKTIAEAKRMVALVNRRNRFQFFRKQQQKNKSNREAARLARLSDTELRSKLTQSMHRQLIDRGVLGDCSREEFHRLVEYEFARVRSLAESPQTEPIQSTLPLH